MIDAITALSRRENPIVGSIPVSKPTSIPARPAIAEPRKNTLLIILFVSIPTIFETSSSSETAFTALPNFVNFKTNARLNIIKIDKTSMITCTPVIIPPNRSNVLEVRVTA
jgi:hypothetical protein